jgi:hypothetical protein
VRSRPKLPKGWSYPIKPSEVEKHFPGVGHVYWGWGSYKLRDWKVEERPCFLLTWQPRTAMPMLILTVAAVPSDKRARIRAWVEAVVAPQAQEWLRALKDRSPTWLDGKHQKTWTWRAPDSN